MIYGAEKRLNVNARRMLRLMREVIRKRQDQKRVGPT